MGTEEKPKLKQFGCLEKEVSALIGHQFDEGIELEHVVNGLVISETWGTSDVIIQIKDAVMKQSLRHLAMSASEQCTFFEEIRSMATGGNFELWL